MRIKAIQLQNFKRFIQPQNISFYNEEEGKINDVTLIVGNNSSGKTSILQAIAAVVGTATRELKKPSDLNWRGLNWELISKNGYVPQISAEIIFTEKELSAVSYLHQKAKESGIHALGSIPEREQNVILQLVSDGDNYKVGAKNDRILNQFRGYDYIKKLLGNTSGATKRYFDQVGGVFWYTAERNNNSLRSFHGKSKMEAIREFLVSRYRFHQDIKLENLSLKDDQRDIFVEMSEMYSKLFPTKKLYKPEPQESLYNSYKPENFFLLEGENKYEITEMSAGEEAIFPILIDFANLKINDSIILIDEIELHLHPQLQQAFIRTLPKWGKNNQFILTTHSEEVASMFRRNQIIYLK